LGPQDGRVELQLNSGTYIRLSENSALQILSMDQDSSSFISHRAMLIYIMMRRRGVSYR